MLPDAMPPGLTVYQALGPRVPRRGGELLHLSLWSPTRGRDENTGHVTHGVHRQCTSTHPQRTSALKSTPVVVRAAYDDPPTTLSSSPLSR
jgi:hypothetical protein